MTIVAQKNTNDSLGIFRFQLKFKNKRNGWKTRYLERNLFTVIWYIIQNEVHEDTGRNKPRISQIRRLHEIHLYLDYDRRLK